MIAAADDIDYKSAPVVAEVVEAGSAHAETQPVSGILEAGRLRVAAAAHEVGGDDGLVDAFNTGGFG
jgi:hypothetical protein